MAMTEVNVNVNKQANKRSGVAAQKQHKQQQQSARIKQGAFFGN